MKSSMFWSSLRGSITLVVVGCFGLLFFEVYHQWARGMDKEVARSQGLRRYLLGVLAGDDGPFAILYNVAHFSMAVLIMIGFVWGLAFVITNVLGGLDPERKFFENVAEKIFGTLEHSKGSGAPVEFAVRLFAPIVGAGLLAGAVFSVSTSLVSLTRVSKDEIRRWEQVNNSLDRLQVLWVARSESTSITTPTPPNPPYPPLSNDLYPVFARYGGTVLETWKQGAQIKQGQVIVQQDCEALDREILRTRGELRHLQVPGASDVSPESAKSVESLQALRADQHLSRYQRLKEAGVVPPDSVEEAETEAKIAKERKLLAVADWNRRKEERSFSGSVLEQWLAFLENLRKGCNIQAPVSGKVERIVKKGAYASADSEHPIAWIRVDR